MTAIDPNRRRLTVGVGSAPPTGLLAAEPSDPDRLRAAGLAELFDPEVLRGRKAVSITSTTDAEMSRRDSFGEKDVDVLIPPGESYNQDDLMAWVKSLGIGYCCKKGLKPESPNQDSYSLLCVEDDFALIAVYDGHGPVGHDISEEARKLLVSNFIQNPERTSNTAAAFEKTFLDCQRNLEGRRDMDASRSGCTVTMAYIDWTLGQFTVAHVGDSRCVLGWRRPGDEKFETDDITVDHKPNLPSEKARIEGSTPPGRVVFDGFYNWRVFAQGGMYPGLNMSRAIGDVIAHKEAGLSAMPDNKVQNIGEISTQKLGDAGGEVVLLLCTDGVWEFIESQMAFEYVVNNPDPQACVEALSAESYKRWMKESDDEISDDISAICIYLRK